MIKLVPIVLMLGFLCSCNEEPKTYDFPTSPYIDFVDLNYVDVMGDMDSLQLTIKIWDEEDDLGISWRQEHERKYDPFEIIVDSVDFNGRAFRPVTYGTKEVYLPFYLYSPSFDTLYQEIYSLTDDRPEFNCEHYDMQDLHDLPGSDSMDEYIAKWDTVYVLRNPNRYNLLVDFYIDFTGVGSNPDSFELVEWEYWGNEYGCGLTYDGRFQDVFSYSERGPFSISNFRGQSPHTLTYNMLGYGFLNVLRTRPFKLHIQVKDREFNESNVLETPVMTLQEITKPD